MHLREETAKIQELFGEYCRSGKETEIPGVTPGRVQHYRRLVYNVVRDTMDSAYPITLAALGEEHWDLLVQDFFSGGIPQSPQIWKLPFEFYRYHAGQETGSRIQKPYLEDLLYFEWIEIEVHTMPDRSYPDYVQHGDIFTDRLAINPEYEIIRLEYPVHLHSAEEATKHRGDYYALIFRVPDTGYVQFLDLSPLNTYIFIRLVEMEVPLDALKGDIANASGIESGKYLDDALSTFIGDLMKKKLILGFIKD
ncbi:MAG: DNA-binding domain-containing protein [Bacteroidota bacterium]